MITVCLIKFSLFFPFLGEIMGYAKFWWLTVQILDSTYLSGIEAQKELVNQPQGNHDLNLNPF